MTIYSIRLRCAVHIHMPRESCVGLVEFEVAVVRFSGNEFIESRSVRYSPLRGASISRTVCASRPRSPPDCSATSERDNAE